MIPENLKLRGERVLLQYLVSYGRNLESYSKKFSRAQSLTSKKKYHRWIEQQWKEIDAVKEEILRRLR